MFVKMYNFSKRENSTKQPTDADITISGEVCFKHTTSLLTPTIIWAVGHEDNVEGDDTRTDDEKAMVTNYCYMNGKYYYVTDVRRVNRNHIEFDCRIDVLATYKEDILDTTAYVEFSDSHGRSDIYDNRVVVTCQTEIEKLNDTDVAVLAGFSNDSEGSVIMNVVSDVEPTKGMGANTSWILTTDQLRAFSNELNKPDGILQSLREAWTNPTEAVISIIWLPIPVSTLKSYGADNLSEAICLHVGSYAATAITPLRVTSSFPISITYPIEIPNNTDVNFTDVNYKVMTLYLPYVGVVDIPSNLYYGIKYIEVKLSIDVLTGDMMYLIYADKAIIASYSSNCAVNIPISSNNYDITPALTGVTMSLTGNPYAIPMLAGGISQMMSQGINTQIKGGIGSKVNNYSMLDIQCVTRKSVLSEDITSQKTIRGLPLYQTVRLANLTGYVETSKASVSINGTLSETQLINNYLNGGIYIE